MPLKTVEAKTPTQEKVQDDTMVLELALYTNYTWRARTYTKGQPYRFKRGDALKLLGMLDAGRQVWRMWSPPPAKVVRKPVVEDATTMIVDVAEEPIHGVDVNIDKKQKRIDVGSDDEIADILGKVEGDEDENVTV